MVNLNQPIRITTTRVLLVAGVGMLLLLHKQAQHHAALPSHPHVFSAQHGPDHIRRPPAPPVSPIDDRIDAAVKEAVKANDGLVAGLITGGVLFVCQPAWPLVEPWPLPSKPL